MYGLNDFNFVAVGNVLPDAAANISDSADGCLAVCNSAGVVLDKTTVLTNDDIKIGVRRNGRTLFSTNIGTTIKQYKAHAYTAPIQQVTTVGYDGTTVQHFLENDYISVGNNYGIVLQKRVHPVDPFNGLLVEKPIFHTVVAEAAYEVDVVDGLTSLYSNRIADGRNTNKWLKMERLINPNSSVANNSWGNATVVQYSKQVIFATTTTGVGLDVNAYVAIEDRVYKITANDTTNKILTLDQHYMGDSGTVLEANVDVITRAIAIHDDTEWGIIITAKDLYFEEMLFQDSIVSFDVFLKGDFTTTTTNTLTTGTASDPGIGTYEMAVQSESEDYWSRVMHTPPDVKAYARAELNATIGDTHDYVILQFVEGKGTLNSSVTNQSFQIEMWLKINVFDSGSVGSDQGVLEVLDTWLAAKASGITTAQDTNLT